MAELLTKEWMKQKSIDSGILMADFFHEVAIEELCCLLLEERSNMSECVFALDGVLAIEGWKRERAILLYTKANREKAILALESSLVKSVGIHWEIRGTRELAQKRLRTTVYGTLEDMSIPIPVEIVSEKDNLYLERHDFVSAISGRKNFEFSYMAVAPEQKLAECLYMIVDRLELLSQMEYYEIALDIVKHHAVDGRRVSEEFRKRWTAGTFDANRMESLRSYRDYHYMLKKWNSYKKNKAYLTGREPAESWEETLDEIMNFVEPIYGFVARDEVFIGDWMPELGRFM